MECDALKLELSEKSTELDHLTTRPQSPGSHHLAQQLASKTKELETKNQKIEELSKDLQIKTQNLQQLVNTELWSKNKEIAKLHNHMTNQSQERPRNKSESHQDSNPHIEVLIKELSAIGIQVTFAQDVLQLTYKTETESIDLKNLNEIIEKLILQKSELEEQVEYLKWLKLISKTDVETEDSHGFESEKAREYCDLLRGHLKSLVKFMKEMLKGSNYPINDEYKRMVLDLLVCIFKLILIVENFISFKFSFSPQYFLTQLEKAIC